MKKAITMAVIVFAIIAFRYYIVNHLILQKGGDANTRRRWIVSTRNISFLVILSISIVIWFEQLRAIAATIVVIAAAVVVATKEVLLNFMGFAYLSSTNFIAVGDRIEIDDIRGDVIDRNMLGVTLLEIGCAEKTNQYTGLTVHVPNSKFLSCHVKNETHMWGDYVFHLIMMPVHNDISWVLAENALLDAATSVCSSYLETAQKSMRSLARKHSLEEPSVAPRVNIQVASPDRLNLILRIPVPTRRRGRLEQEIIRKYFRLLSESKNRKTVEE